MARGDFIDVADYGDPKQSILNPTGAAAPATTSTPGYLTAVGEGVGKGLLAVGKLATAPVAVAGAAGVDALAAGVNAGNNALGYMTGMKFGGVSTDATANVLSDLRQTGTDALTAFGAQPTAAPASPASLAPIKPNPLAAAAKVVSAPPAATSGPVGKVKGYLEIAGAPSTRETLDAAGIYAPGKAPLSVGATSADATAMTNLSNRYAGQIEAQQAPPVVSEPMYGEGGKVIGYRNVVATPQNSFQGRSVEEILGPNDAGRTGRAAVLGTLQNEAAKTSQDSALKTAQGYKAMMEGQKAGVESKFLPDEKKADIGLKVADAAAKEAEARSKLYPNIERLMKDGSPADAAWATKAQAGITAGTHTWAPETQFTMLDDAGKTSVPYKMYGTIPASAAGKQAYDGLWAKYLADVKAYNSNMFHTESDLTALKTNRAAFLNGMRSLGLRIDPITTTAGAK